VQIREAVRAVHEPGGDRHHAALGARGQAELPRLHQASLEVLKQAGGGTSGRGQLAIALSTHAWRCPSAALVSQGNGRGRGLSVG
jgi:hypothetical protein